MLRKKKKQTDDDDNEEQLDPLSLLIHSSSQIVLSGTEEGNHHNAGDDESGSNYGSYNPPMLYIPCVNNEGVDDLEGRYCILSIPIDSSSDDNTIVDNVSSTNNPSSFVLENMTLRPVGIAILNSSHGASAPSPFSYSSSSSTASISKQERPYAITRNQTSNPVGNNSHTELLIIASQQPTNA